MLVTRYLEDRDVDATLNVGADMRKINYCFRYFKELYNQLMESSKQTTKNNNNQQQQQASVTIVDASHYDSKEMKDLKDTLKQRDNEISNEIFMLFFKLIFNKKINFI